MQRYLFKIVCMIMKSKILFVSSALALGLAGVVSTSAAAQHSQGAPKAAARPAVDDLKAFPAATAGQVRHVIRFPAHATEANMKVELIVGRTMSVDCNHHMFGGKLEERTAQGWGYTYYVLDNLGSAASTLMGCSPQKSARKEFVRSGHEQLVRYNSRLPLVIYAPSDVEVRYRIWRADAEDQKVRSPR